MHCIALRRSRNSLRNGRFLLRPACSALAHLLHPGVAERQASLTQYSASRNMASGLPLKTTDSWRPPLRSQPRSGQSCTTMETKSLPLRGQGALSGHIVKVIGCYPPLPLQARCSSRLSARARPMIPRPACRRFAQWSPTICGPVQPSTADVQACLLVSPVPACFSSTWASEHAHVHDKTGQTRKTERAINAQSVEVRACSAYGLALLACQPTTQDHVAVFLHALPGCEQYSQPCVWRDSREH